MSRMNDPQGSSPTTQLRDKASEIADTAKQAATEQFGHLRDTANEYYEQGREKAEEWQQNLEQYVQDQPIKSLLIAAGVGMLLGIIWKRS